jgi:hypothetical protein
MSNVNKVDKELLSDEDLMKVDGGKSIMKLKKKAGMLTAGESVNVTMNGTWTEEEI